MGGCFFRAAERHGLHEKNSPHGMMGWKNLDKPPMNSRMVGGNRQQKPSNTKVLRHSRHFIDFHHENPKVGSHPQYQIIPQEIKPSLKD